eukprot:EG_transcript_11348
MAVVWRLLGGCKNKLDDPTVAGTAQSYARARRRSSATPDSPLMSPANLRRVHTGPSLQQVPEVRPVPEFSITKRSLTQAASLSVNASGSDVAKHSPELESDCSDSNSVETVLEEHPAEPSGPPAADQRGTSSISSGSSIDTAITANSCPESARPTSKQHSETPSSVKDESIPCRGSYVAPWDDDGMEDVDHFLAMVWEARRSAGRLPYWRLPDIERDEEAKRKIIVQGEQELRQAMAAWGQRLRDVAERLAAAAAPKSYTPSYVTSYQLERLEMSTREALAADEAQSRTALRSECQATAQVLLDTEHREEREWQDTCRRFESLEDDARRVLLKAQEEISQQLFEYDQSMMLILNELKRVNHAHHVAKYYST